MDAHKKGELIIILIFPLLLIFSWFRNGLSIAYAEQATMNVLGFNGLIFWPSVWNEKFMTGYYNPTLPVAIVYVFLTLPSQLVLLLNAPAWISQALSFFLVNLLAEIFMYLYVSSIVGRNEVLKYSPFLASLLYILNTATMSVIWNRFLWFGTLSLIPLILLLYHKAFSTKEIPLASLFIGLANMIFSSFLFTIPGVGMLIFLLFYIFFEAINTFKSNNSSYLIKLTIGGIFASVILNLHWFLPLILAPGDLSFMTGKTIGNEKSIEINVDLYEYITRYLYLPFDVIRLIDRALSLPSFIWGSYERFPLVLISLTVPLLAFSSILIYNRDEHVLFFSCFSVLGLFISSGLSLPTGTLLILLMKIFPIAGIIRNAYASFAPILSFCYSYLIAISLSSIIHKLLAKAPPYFLFSKRNITVIKLLPITLLLILLLGFLAWPMWTGKVFSNPDVDRGKGSTRISIPQYYFELRDYFRSQPGDFRIVVVPNPLPGTAEWGLNPYNLNTLSILLLSNHSLVGGWTDIPPLTAEFLSGLNYFLSPPSTIWKVCSMVNAKYIVLPLDLIHNERITSLYLNTSQYVYFFKSFGKIYVYKVDESKIPGMIYAVKTIYVAKNFSGMYTKIKGSFDPLTEAFVLESQTNINLITNVTTIPFLSYSGHGTHYVVRVNSSGPFFLILTQTYSEYWKATINGVPISNHFIVNGFANAWLVNKSGSYTISIDFYPEIISSIGKIIVTFSLIAIALIILYNKSISYFRKK
jgi:hypothetical protein